MILLLVVPVLFVLVNRLDGVFDDARQCPEAIGNAIISYSKIQQLEQQSCIQVIFYPELSTRQHAVLKMVNNTDVGFVYSGMILYVRHGDSWILIPLFFSNAISLYIGGPPILHPNSYIENAVNIYDGTWGRLPAGEYLVTWEYFYPESQIDDKESWLTVIGRFTIYYNPPMIWSLN